MSTKTSRLTIDIPNDDHNRLKRAALMMEMTLKDLVLMSIDEFIFKEPNKVTLKAIRQSQSGKSLKKFKNLDALFMEIGI